MAQAPDDLLIRQLSAEDDMRALTALLHRAYAALGAVGLNYTAVDQSVETTVARAAAGACFVAVSGGAIVGTVAVRRPQPADALQPDGAPSWYRRPDVAIFGQLGVEPAFAGRGIGRRLVDRCETWAREQGLDWLALDTAEPAVRLRELYAGLGYVDVDMAQWEGKRYRSVIMAKALCAAGEGIKT